MNQLTFNSSCEQCPRLADFLTEVRTRYPQYWARPVPAFGDQAPRILIVGLAPGLHGANRSGRPFTGDHAGLLLYETLFNAGLSTKVDSISKDDGLTLKKVRITNAVKCVPPANKPLPAEIRTCNSYLKTELQQLPTVKVIVALGRVAHEGVLQACGKRSRAHEFGHAREHQLAEQLILLDSYHCSRYNTQTRRLTPEMFTAVIRRACIIAEV
jgi:uracil-DNA glycosylase